MTAARTDLLFERGLPSDPEAERFVLAAAMLGRPLGKITAVLGPGDFSLEKHRRIFGAMIQLEAEGMPLDRVTLAYKLQKRGQLESVDGATYLASLDEGMPEIVNLDAYVSIVWDKALRRRAIIAHQQSIQECLGAADSTPEILARAAAAIAALSEAAKANGAAKWSIRDIPSVWSLDARVTWLVPDILPEGAVTLLTGDSEVGKSTLALALCGAIARGGTFLGRECLKRLVVYMDRENPLAVVRERLDRLRIMETPDLIVWGGWNDPPTYDPTASAVSQFARDEHPLMVFDSLVAYHTGSEQDASETRRHMQAYRKLAYHGATVLVLHNTGKSEGAREYRGSSDIKAAVDMAWLLENLGEPGTLETLRLKPFKRRIALASPMRVEYKEGSFRVADQQTETNREIIERIVGEHPGETQGKLVKRAHEAGVAKNRAEQLLADAERNGWLIVDTGARGAKTYRPGVLEVQI